MRDSNFNGTAWKKVEEALREHVRLTQSLMRLPPPAQNRIEPQRIDVVATPISLAVVSDLYRC